VIVPKVYPTYNHSRAVSFSFISSSFWWKIESSGGVAHLLEGEEGVDHAGGGARSGGRGGGGRRRPLPSTRRTALATIPLSPSHTPHAKKDISTARLMQPFGRVMCRGAALSLDKPCRHSQPRLSAASAGGLTTHARAQHR
jgi:hypothetical protein